MGLKGRLAGRIDSLLGVDEWAVYDVWIYTAGRWRWWYMLPAVSKREALDEAKSRQHEVGIAYTTPTAVVKRE